MKLSLPTSEGWRRQCLKHMLETLFKQVCTSYAYQGPSTCYAHIILLHDQTPAARKLTTDVNSGYAER